MLNDKGFQLEEVECDECGYFFIAAPNDPTDPCECPVCKYVEPEVELGQVLEMLA